MKRVLVMGLGRFGGGVAAVRFFRARGHPVLVTDLYDASIRTTDDALEELWSVLRELGLEEDTLLVVTSDHGEGLGQHGEMEHSNVLHEEALRVPLWIRMPRPGHGPRRSSPRWHSPPSRRHRRWPLATRISTLSATSTTVRVTPTQES